MSQFILYIRHGCHLCEDMQQQLLALQHQYSFSLEIVDVDSNAEWIQSYGHLVPVLKCGAEVLCHYFLDQVAVLQAIGKQPHP